jgi:hypothetical protein
MCDRVIQEGATITYGNLRYNVKKIKSNMPSELSTIKISKFHIIGLLFNKGIADLGIVEDD